jgi:ABC-2 type transport system permease protein
MIGLAAALVGLAPRLGLVSWVVLGWAMLLALFGPLLRLPEWLQRVSPIADVPTTPVEDWLPTVVLVVVAVVLPALALAAFRRRDVPA